MSITLPWTPAFINLKNRIFLLTRSKAYHWKNVLCCRRAMKCWNCPFAILPLLFMSTFNLPNNEMTAFFSVHDVTMLSQWHLWRHKWAHTRVPLVIGKQPGWCRGGAVVNTLLGAITDVLELWMGIYMCVCVCVYVGGWGLSMYGYDILCRVSEVSRALKDMYEYLRAPMFTSSRTF